MIADCAVQRIDKWVAAEMYCPCGCHFACAAPLAATQYECPDCGAMLPAPIWGDIHDLDLDLDGVRLN